MITLRNVTKSFWVGAEKRPIVQNLTMTIPRGRNLALLGRNGAGKSTLLNLIAGTIKPDSGVIELGCRVSWPLGFAGSFHRAMTGIQNIRFVARIYGADVGELISFVEDFSELGDFLSEPVGVYSSGMRARLAFGISMGIQFDVYLVDEITAVGDENFKLKCRKMFSERLAKSDVIMVSHNPRTLRETCDCGLVIEKGRISYYDNIDAAIKGHSQNMRASRDATNLRLARANQRAK